MKRDPRLEPVKGDIVRVNRDGLPYHWRYLEVGTVHDHTFRDLWYIEDDGERYCSLAQWREMTAGGEVLRRARV